MTPADNIAELKAQLEAHPNVRVYFCLNKDAGPDEQELEITDISFEHRTVPESHGDDIDVIVVELS